MKEVEVVATFGPAVGDWATLSKSSRRTLEAIYQHPLSHGLEWSDVMALFEKLGTVDHKSHHDVAFGIGGEHHRIHKPQGKDLAATEVMALRHMLSRAGWAPQNSTAAAVVGSPASGKAVASASTDLMVVIDHHGARLYHLDVRSKDLVDHVIKPYDPHHILHHLSHKDHPRERGQRSPEDHGFYGRIAEAVSEAGAIVLIGHGNGHSNAAHHLTEYLHKHHPETFQKLACEVVADLSSLTAPQLLDLARRALTSGMSPSSFQRTAP